MSEKIAKLLLVEPNMVNRKLISSLLESAGYQVEAPDPADMGGVAEGYQLILMDLDRFDADEGQNFNGTPILWMADEGQMLPAGLDPQDLLFRPVSPDMLQDKVKAALPADGPAAGAEAEEGEEISPEDIMRHALDLCAEQVTTSAEGPFAAVIVKNGKIIAEACDQVKSSGDPTAKAALLAIRSACEGLHSPILGGCEIYLSCEPCPLSLAAIYEAGLDRIYYAMLSDDIDRGYRELYDEMALPIEQRTMPAIAFLQDEGRIVLEQWKTTQG